MAPAGRPQANEFLDLVAANKTIEGFLSMPGHLPRHPPHRENPLRSAISVSRTTTNPVLPHEDTEKHKNQIKSVDAKVAKGKESYAKEYVT